MWQTANIAGKPADVFDPAAGSPRFALIYLHTYAMESLAGNAVWTALLDQHGLACICPSGKRSWWTDRICPEFDPGVSAESYVVSSVLPYAGARWNLGPRGLGLIGVSMGGQGALRLGFKHPERFPIIAAISPCIEYHELYWSGTPIDDMYASKEQCRQDTAPMHVHPTHWPPHIYFCCDRDDPWQRGSDRLHEKLGALGVGHECDLHTRAGGHTWSYFNAMADRSIRFAMAGLQRESRRLI